MAFDFFGGKKAGSISKAVASSSSSSKVTLTRTLVAVEKPKAKPAFIPKALPKPFKSSSSTVSGSASAPLSSSSSSSAKKRKGSPPQFCDSPTSKNSHGKDAPVSSYSSAAKRRKPDVLQRVLPESSSDEDETGTSSGAESSRRTSRAATPHGGEYVVERAVASNLGRLAWQGFLHSEDVIRDDLRSYVRFFASDTDDEPASIMLEYPAPGASERFLLLSPKNRDGEYDPIHEIVRVVRTVLEHFLAHSENEPHPLSLPQLPSQPPSPGPRSPLNPSSPAPAPQPMFAAPVSEPAQIIRLLERSIAPNILSMPLFFQAIAGYNALVCKLRESGEMKKNIEAMKGVRQDIWALIGDQCYQRVVGPRTEALKDYEPFSDHVYGEMNPAFVSLVAQQTSLSSNSTFVDLGSGVGNCVLQVALQTGAASYGCESQPNPSQMAKLQLAEARRRWAMWGLEGGDAEVWEGDFCESPKVARVLQQADLVICNNYAFSPQLNERLALLFLDLKEGAKIVSLKSFVSPDFRLSERTSSSPQAILRRQEHRFRSQAVSWTHEGGVYYIQTVDRSMLRRYQEKLGKRSRR